MSEFFRALERAERERALRSKATTPEDASARPYEAPAPAPAAVATETNGGTATAVIETVDVPPLEAFPVVTGVREEPDVAAAADPLRPTETTADRPPAERTRARPLAALLAGQAGRGSDEVDEHLVSLITPDTFEADQYRVLRHTVEQRRRTAGLGVVAVSSAGAGDGKTTTAINLAGALAQDRAARVLLVDCDLRGSAMARRLGLAEGRGLVQAIVDPLLTLDDAIRHLPRFNLDVMGAGFETASPYELLKSPRLGELFDAARRRYDYVVVDTPPILPFPDCRVLGKVVDGFLVVIHAHRTPRRLVDEALGILPKELLLGVVFNGEDGALSPSYHPYYGRQEIDAAEPRAGWGASARRALSRAWRDGRAAGTTGH